MEEGEGAVNILFEEYKRWEKEKGGGKMVVLVCVHKN